MPARIEYSELSRRITEDDGDDRQLAGYFRVDPAASDLLHPCLAVAPGLVFDGLGEFAGRDAAAIPLLELWSQRRTRRLRGQYYERVGEGFSGLKILAQGDAWLDHPGDGADLFEQLSHHDEYAVYVDPVAGDWLSHIQQTQRMITLVERHRCDLLVLGGGLRDILGRRRLKLMLRQAAKAELDPGAFLGHRLETYCAELEQAYRDCFSQLIEVHPGISVVLHGYDYMRPAHGIWLGQPLGELGIEDTTTQAELVVELVDRLNLVLSTVANEPRLRHNVHHADCRGALKPEHWLDEVRPTPEGFAKICDRLVRCIERARAQSL